MKKKTPPLDPADEAEKLIRFVQAIKNHERPDPAALSAGIFACIEKIQVLRTRRTGPKPRKQFGIDTPQFVVAQRYVAGELTHADAVSELCLRSNIGKRTAEKDLAEMKPRAEVMAELYSHFQEINRKN